MVKVYNEEEKKILDDGCGPLRLGQVGTVLQEIQKAINTNEKISLDYDNTTGILKILIDGEEKAYVNLGLEKYVNQAEIVDDPEGLSEGKYIKLLFEGGADPVFVPTADIGKIYSSGEGIYISSEGVIACTLDLSEYYTKSEIDMLLDTGINVDLSNYYTKAETNNVFNNIPLLKGIEKSILGDRTAEARNAGTINSIDWRNMDFYTKPGIYITPAKGYEGAVGLPTEIPNDWFCFLIVIADDRPYSDTNYGSTTQIITPTGSVWHTGTEPPMGNLYIRSQGRTWYQGWSSWKKFTLTDITSS